MADAINRAGTLAVSWSSGDIGRVTLDGEPHRALSRYEAARQALAEARRVDEVKEIRDRAAALAEYAKQAKDTELLNDATEIRLRAERRAGELLAEREMAKGGEQYHQSTGSNLTPVRTLADDGITKTQSSRWQKLWRLPDEKFEIRVEHAKARVAGMTTSAPSYSNVKYTGENEWFTPADWIERGRRALGEIDLDPASHAIAQQTVGANRFFTAADDGLSRPWFGRVWLNPPFNRELLSPFVQKLIEECASGRVEQALLLTHNYTDTAWFHAAARAARTICFPSGRVKFLSPVGDECSLMQGQAFFYFGRDDAGFLAAFADAGLILRVG